MESSAADEIEVRAPATGESIGRVRALDADGVVRLAGAARAAQPGWAAAGFDGRAAVMKRARHWLLENADRVRSTISAETGKVHEDAQLEVAVTAQALAFWAKAAPRYLADERVPATAPLTLGRKVVVRYEPLELVAVIGPWNYPLANSFCDCIPALTAGCAVLYKPSEETPLTAELAVEMMGEAGLPDGALGLAQGAGETGRAVIDEADYVMFTGSTATGQKVMERATKSMTQVSLELGGKDPMIVLADADLERAANGAVYYSMLNSGQVCIAIERAYVEGPVYEDFVRKVVEKVAALRHGEPGEPGTVDVGAITFEPQLRIIESHVDDAIAKGAIALTGGRRKDGNGLFFEPTVLIDVDHSMAVMTEESFGPILPIMRVADADEAVRLANDSKYGLQASIWTGDGERGEQLARRIEAGACCVNDAIINFTVFGAPMGGWKSSGVGHRHGAGGIRKYCRSQTVLVNRFPLHHDIHMFPYKRAISRTLALAADLMYGSRRRLRS